MAYGGNKPDNFFLDILRALSSGLFQVLVPLGLIGAGAGAIALGMNFEITFLAWFGLALIGAGVLWGAFVFLAITNSWF